MIWKGLPNSIQFLAEICLDYLQISVENLVTVGHSNGLRSVCGAGGAHDNQRLIVALLQAGWLEVLLHRSSQHLIDADAAPWMIAHGDNAYVQLCSSCTHLLVLVAIAEDHPGLGDSVELLNVRLLEVDVQCVEDNAVEVASICHGGYVCGVSRYNPHNVRLLKFQTS